ncbi:hypothetical protein [Streptomyces megasporus]|uniref:hypothetical protein n=1 Tax=Streptomyces megasporus TaxID=44060 RepID=UPI0004E12D03|nr:hypothetical protein [Streptomyces megasporus]
MVAGSTAAIALGTLIGAWFMPFLVGAAVGAVGRLRSARLWRGASAVALAGALGWALPLGRQALGGAPVGEVARTAAALAGLPPLATVTVSAALLIAVVQALVGFWVGRTVVPRRG